MKNAVLRRAFTQDIMHLLVCLTGVCAGHSSSTRVQLRTKTKRKNTMRVSFTADSLFFEDDGDVLYCAITGDEENVLVFQCSTEAEDDSGIHFEYNDQSNGDYGCIKTCNLKRDELRVELSKQLGELEDVEGFDVSLNLDDGTYKELENGLSRIFRGEESSLKVN